jgi:hypothetical protein
MLTKKQRTKTLVAFLKLIHEFNVYEINRTDEPDYGPRHFVICNVFLPATYCILKLISLISHFALQSQHFICYLLENASCFASHLPLIHSHFSLETKESFNSV